MSDNPNPCLDYLLTFDEVEAWLLVSKTNTNYRGQSIDRNPQVNERESREKRKGKACEEDFVGKWRHHRLLTVMM